MRQACKVPAVASVVVIIITIIITVFIIIHLVAKWEGYSLA
jgi:hypothetical protein